LFSTIILALASLSFSQYNKNQIRDNFYNSPEYEIFSVLPLTLLAPNGGEVLPSGATHTIQWEPPPEATKFDLYYSLNSGTTWKKIISKGKSECTDCHSGSDNIWFTCADCHSIHAHSTGCTDCHNINAIHEIHTNTDVERYIWKVPCPKNNKQNCLVKIIGYDSSDVEIGEDVSDSPFTIEVVYVISPNGGQILRQGTTWNIRWQANCTIRPVSSIELYYTTGGGIWKPITSLAGNTVSYPWTVPYASSTKCKVKVVLKNASGTIVGKDKSDEFFTIQP
jgi:hypothetical protein